MGSPEPWTHYIPGADLALGQRHDAEMRDAAAAARARYLRAPWWLPYTLDRTAPGRCPLPAALSAPADPAAWRARPGFTAMLSSHYAYPRRGLYDALSAIGRVSAPGSAFHNAEWPTDIAQGAQKHLVGKPAYLRRFRFNVCPENSQSTDAAGGYNTEKLPQALAAGTVPVYWGDALDAGVFNPARVLRFNGSFAATAAAVARLERDPAAAAAFFAEPALLPTAQAVVDAWCDRVAEALAWLATRVDEKRAARAGARLVHK